MVKHVLVTGAYGLIGGIIYSHLQAQPASYTAYALARRRHPSERVSQGRGVRHGADPARAPPVARARDAEPEVAQPFDPVRCIDQGPHAAPGHEDARMFADARRDPGAFQVSLGRHAVRVQ